VSISISRLIKRTPKPKPDPDDEGRMTLIEHLRELRGRLLKSVIALIVAMIVAWQFYSVLFNLLQEPLDTAVAAINQTRSDIKVGVNWGSISSPLMLQLKITFVAALVAASPIWLYQLWAFIVPGLHKNERKWSLAFLGTAGPLFIVGVLVGYLAMPKGIQVLLSFTPNLGTDSTVGTQNLLDVQSMLDFILRLLLVFGIAFEIPVFTILLNLVGVLSAQRLSKWRAPIIFFIFVFAAVATPSIDPFTMLMLAVPMSALFIVSEVIARFIDKRRRASLVAAGVDVEKIERAGETKDD
jgi:sec-independent protein translocase protein TatC